MYQKEKRLAVQCQKLAAAYAPEYTMLSFLSLGMGRKKRGRERPPIIAKLMKTKLEKMSDFSLSTMLMIIGKLHGSFHDVIDKKGT